MNLLKINLISIDSIESYKKTLVKKISALDNY